MAPENTSSRSVTAVWHAPLPRPVTGPISVLRFIMEDEPFGVAADAVLEVTDIPGYVELPGSAAWLTGMAIHKSLPIAVVDLPAFVFDLARATVPAQRAMVVSVGWGRILFMVQRIDGLVQATLPTATTAGKGTKPGFEVSRTSDGQTLQLLNITQLCNSVEFLRPGSYADLDQIPG